MNVIEHDIVTINQVKTAAAAFAGGRPVPACSRTGSGHIHQTYKVVLEGDGQEALILQRLNTQVFPNPAAINENILKIAAFLENSGFEQQILKPLPADSGAYLWIDDFGHHWRAFPLIKNTYSIDEASHPEQAKEIARTFGAYLAALAGFDATQLHLTIPDFHNTPLRLAHLKSAVNAAAFPQRLDAATKLITTLLDWEHLLNPLLQLSFPVRVTHNDTKLNNVLLDQTTGKGVCVIDLDTVMPGNILYDFGDLVRTAATTLPEDDPRTEEVAVNRQKYQALAEGFFAPLEPVLSDLEKKYLPYGAVLITYEQSIRFLTDYLQGDVYYPVKYPEHNLVRAANQAALVHSLLDELFS